MHIDPGLPNFAKHHPCRVLRWSCWHARTPGRRKYEFTPTIDAKLHEIYRHPGRRTHLTVKQYAEKLG